jgi:hypothetical protein
MMQSCASAAKLRGGGLILPFSIESQGNTSGPRHLEPSSATRHQRTDKAEIVGWHRRNMQHVLQAQGRELMAGTQEVLLSYFFSRLRRLEEFSSFPQALPGHL